MTLQILRFSVLDEHIIKAEQGIDRLFDAIHAAKPAGIRYVAMEATDGTEIVLLLDLENDAVNPLFAIPQAVAVRHDMPAWTTDTLAPRPMTVLGDYRMLG